MPLVTCFRLNGLQLMFYSSDHTPPHFHAEMPGEWNIRVYIETTTAEQLHYEAKWPTNPAPRLGAKLLKTLATLTAQHREALLQEWEAKVCQN